MKIFYKSLFISLLCFIYSFAQAQDEMETDRPNISYSAETLPKGMVQAETGFQYNQVRQNGVRTDSLVLPSLWIRIGLLANLELRIFDQLIEQRKVRAGEVTRNVFGVDNLKIGLKGQLFKGRGIIPQFSILTHLTVPTGGDFRNKKIHPEFRLLFGNDVTDKLQLNYNLGWEGSDEYNKGIAMYSFVVQFTASPKLRLFVENYGALDDMQYFEAIIDAGVLYALLPNLQIDLSAGKDLTKALQNIEVGLSLRLPK